MSYDQYEFPNKNIALDQGDVIEKCPLPFLPQPEKCCAESEPEPYDVDVPPRIAQLRVVVMTQACDLNKKQPQQRVVVCPVRVVVDSGTPSSDEMLISSGDLGNIMKGRVIGLHYLSAVEENHPIPSVPAMVVDLRQVYTVPRALLETLIQQENRPFKLGMLDRANLAIRFAYSFIRVGLP